MPAADAVPGKELNRLSVVEHYAIVTLCPWNKRLYVQYDVTGP